MAKHRNKANPKGVSAKDSIAIANRQIWQREFNPDYDQIVKRISLGVKQGLNNGQPPPGVSR